MRTIQVPAKLMEDVRTLRRMMDGETHHQDIAERDFAIDMLKDHVAELAIAILMKADRDHLDYFLSNR